jgi:phosphoglycerate dehydrogenase-like enzyme
MTRDLFVALADVLRNDTLRRDLERAFDRVHVAADRGTAVAEMMAIGDGLDAAIIGVKEHIGSSVLHAVPNLKVLGSVGAGTNHLDLEALAHDDVTVITTPGANAISVAEHTLMMILALAKRALSGHSAVIAGLDRSGMSEPPIEIRGLRAGLLGAGTTARALLPLLEALGITVSVWTKNPQNHKGLRVSTLEGIFQSSDIISIHLPLVNGTRGMVNAGLIELLPAGAMLVNTARKEIVDQGDLIKALRARPDLYVAIDDFDLAEDGTTSGVGERHSLWSPHVAGVTVQSLIAMHQTVVCGILAFFEGSEK